MNDEAAGNSLVALNANWLNDSGGSWAQDTASGDATIALGCLTSTSHCYSCGTYPCSCWRQWTISHWPYPVTAKIRLLLSEVDVLRKAAKADAKLRAVLLKMTPHIEVEVDL